MPVTSVAVLGSTGSIGTQTLEVVADQPDEFDVVAIGAASSVGLLIEQATRFRPPVVALADASLAASVAAVPYTHLTLPTTPLASLSIRLLPLITHGTRLSSPSTSTSP